MRASGLSQFLLALPAAAACAPADRQPPGAAEAVEATAMAGCTQEDLPALIIRVRPANRPGTELHFEIAGPPAAPLPRRYRLSALRRDPGSRPADLARVELLRNGRSVGWLSGEIVLERLEPGDRAAGSYQVVENGAPPLAGRFVAGWNPRPAGCG
jgi:hypothetical protein